MARCGCIPDIFATEAGGGATSGGEGSRAAAVPRPASPEAVHAGQG